jgi:hypothetical protein
MALILPVKKRHVFYLSRMPNDLQKLRDTKMRTLKQLILAAAFIFCISMSASAQKNGNKKPPPKEGKPPVVVVKGDKGDKGDKERPKDEKNRGNDNRGKKPPAYFFRMEE